MPVVVYDCLPGSEHEVTYTHNGGRDDEYSQSNAHWNVLDEVFLIFENFSVSSTAPIEFFHSEAVIGPQ